MADKHQETALVPTEQHALVAKPRETSYWERVQHIYHIAFRVLLIALPLYVVVFMAICVRAFTYESVSCFFQDLQATTSFVTSDYGNVSFTYDSATSNVLSYRGGVAVVTKDGVEIYSPDGERLLRETAQLAAPRAVASRKYLIAYDLGGTGYMVANTYTSVHEGKTDYPIYGAEAADTGHFAFITSSAEHLSQVLVYDGNANLIHRFGRSIAYTDVAISENGKHIALVGLYSQAGNAFTSVELYRIGETEPAFVLAFEDEMPLAIDFTDGKHIAVLTDRQLRVFDFDGDNKAEVPCAGKPIAFDCAEGGVALVLEVDEVPTGYRTILLDKKGKTVYDKTATERVSALCMSDSHAFLLTKEHVLAVETASGEEHLAACEAGATGLVPVEGALVRVIFAGEAQLYAME